MINVATFCFERRPPFYLSIYFFSKKKKKNICENWGNVVGMKDLAPHHLMPIVNAKVPILDIPTPMSPH